MERAKHGEFFPLFHRSTEPEALDDLQEWHGPGRLHDLSKSLLPGLSLSKLALANRVVTRDSRAAGAAATRNRLAMGEFARLREVVEVPSTGTWLDVRDSLDEHGIHGRQAALPIRIKRSRDLEAEVVRTSMAVPTFDNVAEDIIGVCRLRT